MCIIFNYVCQPSASSFIEVRIINIEPIKHRNDLQSKPEWTVFSMLFLPYHVSDNSRNQIFNNIIICTLRGACLSVLVLLSFLSGGRITGLGNKNDSISLSALLQWSCVSLYNNSLGLSLHICKTDVLSWKPIHVQSISTPHTYKCGFVLIGTNLSLLDLFPPAHM